MKKLLTCSQNLAIGDRHKRLYHFRSRFLSYNSAIAISRASLFPYPPIHYRLPITIECSNLTFIQGIDSVHG
ncbi:hypothetical protein [Spirulina sp. 06S082]|uniref:hypothetical protein n=1 Tax=Spirulina sp. 06S082 TaxID=3110248 RepID=UPI002B1FC576|nr:hypothetical protein [Spirulina sp. 06S082]MEA5472535.1 hypothetical protein [Spirulina sp. 06S082]